MKIIKDRCKMCLSDMLIVVCQDAEPIVSSGYKEGEWKLTFNTIRFEEICRSINKVAFVQGYVNNSKDPFIICLNLKTNGNFKCLNKIKDILYKVFKKLFLDNNYTYSSVHIRKN